MIQEFIVVAILLGVFDYIWLNYFFVNMWSTMIHTIQSSPLELKTNYIIPAYILMTLSIVIYVLPKINKQTIVKDSILYGGLMGLIIYGIFDLTNLIVFKHYSISVAVIDISWGTFLFSVTTIISKIILNYMEVVL